MAWRWLRRLWQPYETVADLRALAQGTAAWVEIEGRVDTLDVLRDPVGGEPCVAIEYRAWPPSTTIGMDGATSHNSRAYQVTARQAVDFLLVDGVTQVLVQIDPGDDVLGLHQRMLSRYGVSLRAESDMVLAGQRVRVAGRVVQRNAGTGTPHRELPYAAIVRADRLRTVADAHAGA